jgi:hypothetical protein
MSATLPPRPWAVRNVAKEAGIAEAKPGAGIIFIDANGIVIWPRDHADAIVAAVNAYYGAEIKQEEPKS